MVYSVLSPHTHQLTTHGAQGLKKSNAKQEYETNRKAFPGSVIMAAN